MKCINSCSRFSEKQPTEVHIQTQPTTKGLPFSSVLLPFQSLLASLCWFPLDHSVLPVKQDHSSPFWKIPRDKVTESRLCPMEPFHGRLWWNGNARCCVHLASTRIVSAITDLIKRQIKFFIENVPWQNKNKQNLRERQRRGWERGGGSLPSGGLGLRQLDQLWEAWPLLLPASMSACSVNTENNKTFRSPGATKRMKW